MFKNPTTIALLSIIIHSHKILLKLLLLLLLPQPVPHHTEAPAHHGHQEDTHEAADDVDDGHGGGDTPAGEKVSHATARALSIKFVTAWTHEA